MGGACAAWSVRGLEPPRCATHRWEVPGLEPSWWVPPPPSPPMTARQMLIKAIELVTEAGYDGPGGLNLDDLVAEIPDEDCVVLLWSRLFATVRRLRDEPDGVARLRELALALAAGEEW
jgi:hypothetical protein